jgi:membrane protein
VGGAAAGVALGSLLLLMGATAAFAQLQSALNRAWRVEPDPTRGDIRNFLLKRVFSFAMILVVAFMLLVSLVLSAALSAFGDVIAAAAPGRISHLLLEAVHNAVALAVVTTLFAFMYRVLPDAVVAWRDAWAGAAATALLFVLGKAGIGMYLGQIDPGTAYGAAGSLAVVLLWVYYSAMILLLGAHFTFVWAERHARPVRPEPGAARVIVAKERADGA